VDDLVAILLAEAREYRRLVPLLEEEERVLVRADAAALADVSARRQALLVRLARLEGDRLTALGHVAAAIGAEPRTLTVSRLIELAPASASSLEAVREELGGLLHHLLAHSSRNRAVAERTLGYLRGLFASVVSALSTEPTYSPAGRSDRPLEELRLLDRHA
jgi:flagellar FlgN protein